MRFVVYRAQGMVMADLDLSSFEAMARLRAHAFSVHRRLTVVADDILARRLEMKA